MKPDITTKKELGAMLAARRTQLGLTQAQILERAGWSSDGRIGNYERGYRSLRWDELVTLCEALGLRIDFNEREGAGAAASGPDARSALTQWATGDLIAELLSRINTDMKSNAAALVTEMQLATVFGGLSERDTTLIRSILAPYHNDC